MRSALNGLIYLIMILSCVLLLQVMIQDMYIEKQKVKSTNGAKWYVKYVMHVWATDTEGYGKTNRKRKGNNTMCKVRISGEVEDEDFSYDYSGVDTTSCSKTFEYDPNDLLDPTSTVVKTILKGNKQ